MVERAKMGPGDIRAAVAEISKMITFAGGETKARAWARDTHGWSARRTNKVIGKVLEIWHRDDAKTLRYTKSQAVRRIREHIDRASARGQMAAVMVGEGLLARIQGTEAPVQIEAHHQVTGVFAVLEGMDVADMQRLADEHTEMETLATEARQLRALAPAPQLLAPRETITDDGGSSR